MKIASVCNPDVVVIRPDETVLEAARRMRERHVGDLVVVRELPEGRIPLGVLTDRDIVVGIIAKDIDHLKTLTVADVLTSPPILAKESDDVSTVLDKMRRNVVRRMPVIDTKGHLVGIFTLDDVLGVLADELASIGALVSRQRTYEAEKRPD